MKLKQLRSVKFDALTHIYVTTDGRFLEGVTALMKNQGLYPKEYDKVSEEVLHRAAARGSAVHQMLEEYDNEGKTVTQREYSWIDGSGNRQTETTDFSVELKSYSALGLQVIASEYLVSDKSMVASSIDKVVYVDENTVDLADIKSTSTFHNDIVSWQLSIYKVLFERQNPDIKVRSIYGVHVKKGQAKIIPLVAKPESAIDLLFECERTGNKFLELYNEDRHAPDTSGIIPASLVPQLFDTECRIISAREQIKQWEAEVAEYRDQIYQRMVAAGIDEIAIGAGKYKVKLPYTKNVIDTAALKRDGLYDSYVKQTEIKGTVNFTNKNK